MNDALRSLVAARLLGLRTPLSRIALAASQLARDAQRPAALVQLTGIDQAVRDLDARIEALTQALVDLRPELPACQDVEATLAELHRRLAPGLEARGIDFRLCDGPAAGARAEPHTLRRGAVALLRAGASCTGPGGRLALRPARAAGILGLEIECRRRGGSAFAEPGEALEQLRDFAELHGARLERRVLPDGLAATLWLPESPT